MNNFMNMFMQMIQRGAPEQQIMQMFGNNPLFKQAINMSKGKSPQQMEEMFKNIALQKGISPQQLEQFLHMFGMR